MNEREWGKKFREETDELLFGDLQFDESLKQKVRDKIAAEAGSAETDAADAPMRTRRALRRPRLRKAYGVMLAASVVVVVAAAGAFGGLLKPDHNGLYTAGHEGAEIMMTPETVGGTNFPAGPKDIQQMPAGIIMPPIQTRRKSCLPLRRRTRARWQ